MQTQRASYDFSKNTALWQVEDRFFDSPDDKFHKDHSPLFEATVEQWGCYQFENIRVLPDEMITFVENFVKLLRIVPSEYTDVKDVCRSIMVRIDYEEPYFFLVDTLIQMSHNELAHTYRHKATGDVLNPSRIETFAIKRDWDYKPFRVIADIMQHKEMVKFLNSPYVPPQFQSREEALMALFSKISSVVWGDVGWLEDVIENALENHAESLVYGERRGPSHQEMSSVIMHDKLFWIAGALGLITWFKGPGAVPFLTQFHQIYAHLLDIDEHGRVVPIPGTGGEAVVDGTDIYTRHHLEFLPGRRADTCACCGKVLHCAKQVNITSLLHPECSCGETRDPMVVEEPYGYHNKRNCQAYRERYKPRVDFVCQRCIFMTVSQQGNHMKCGRTICPAVNCPHHMGNMARVAALTHQRTKQLTAPQRG